LARLGKYWQDYMMTQFTQNNLLPKTQSILNTITDHQLVSLDFIQRRFMSTPSRTLRYHLQQLIKKGYIKKYGVTRGALYSSINFKLA
jgi:repressor of nif and glnA expression